MQSNRGEYKYIKDFIYTKKILNKTFGENILILSDGYSTEHISQPAFITMLFIPKKLDVEITFDTNRINAIIKDKDAALPLHRYLINEGTYRENDFQLDESGTNYHVIEHLVETLKLLLVSNELYFYYWEGKKRYKRKGDSIISLKKGEF
jgi:hypothetical protein